VQALLRARGHVICAAVVRELLAELKRRRALAQARKRAAERMHVHVEARDAVWSGDGTQLGRDASGAKIVAQGLKDVATTHSLALSIGGPPCGKDTLAQLEAAEQERGTLPHVIVYDNGPEYRNRLVMGWLAERKVTVLWNLPHTPEHNAWAESSNGELKTELRARGELPERGADPSQGPGSLAEAGVPSTRAHFERCVPRALAVLNARTRPSRGGLTAAQLDKILPRAEDRVQRARFYETACAAIEAAVQGIDDARARRRAEREAILCTLEQFGLVTRTRGRRPATCSKAERLS
jgi:transposase InsO family protein